MELTSFFSNEIIQFESAVISVGFEIKKKTNTTPHINITINFCTNINFHMSYSTRPYIRPYINAKRFYRTNQYLTVYSKQSILEILTQK